MKEKLKYIPEFIYGAVDGTVTTFAVVAASVGAGLSSGVIVVLGVANLLADGFSMGASAFLSSQSDKENDKAQKSPKAIGAATFVAFLVAGLAPLLVYVYDVIMGHAKEANQTLFYISIGCTLVAFVVVGYIKSRTEKEKLYKSIIATVGLGMIAAALSYFAGDWLATWLGVAVG